MKLDFRVLFENRIGIHCNTEEKSIAFLKEMDGAGVKWRSNDKASSTTYFDRYYDRTVYLAKDRKITYTNTDWCKMTGYTVIEFDDYEWENFVQFDELTMNVEDFLVGLFE